MESFKLPSVAVLAARDTFDALMGELDYPMFIVTVAHGAERSGCLVGFATQCSIDPPRFLVCLSKANHTYRVARDAEVLAVHFVPAGAESLAELFGGETGDRVDKFARCEWHPGPGGVPLLAECPNRFVGAVRGRADGGDHVIHVLEPVAAERGHRVHVPPREADRSGPSGLGSGPEYNPPPWHRVREQC
jgi:flavin reductase (DIM6/NTAB) family NADH-FMN oxidoreductase RutF